MALNIHISLELHPFGSITFQLWFGRSNGLRMGEHVLWKIDSRLENIYFLRNHFTWNRFNLAHKNQIIFEIYATGSEMAILFELVLLSLRIFTFHLK